MKLSGTGYYSFQEKDFYHEAHEGHEEGKKLRGFTGFFSLVTLRVLRVLRGFIFLISIVCSIFLRRNYFELAS
jgi:heme/copper-type cytochrome/quinol oxidase subunit 3